MTTSSNALKLRQDRRDAMRKARQVLDAMRVDMPAAELRRAEKEHDELIDRIDEIDEQLDREEGLSQRMSRRPIGDDMACHGGDGGPGEYEDQVFALRSGQTFADYVRERRADHEFVGLGVGAYLRAMVRGPQTEMEKRALAEGTDSAGGYTVPEILSARLIDRMRVASVVFRAGAQTVPLTSDINYVAKVASDPVPAWRAENANIAESDPTFGRATFTARSLAVLVKISRELLEDSLNIETALPNVMAIALAQELDRVALLGTGTPPQPRGVANFTGLTANAFGGGALSSYGPLIAARTALRTVNADVTAYIMSPRDEGQLAGLVDTQGQPLALPPAIANVPMLVTSKIPTDLGTGTDESMILAGEWAKLMIGIRSDIRIDVLRERFAGEHQYGFIAHMRADVAAEHEAAFTVLSEITPPVEE